MARHQQDPIALPQEEMPAMVHDPSAVTSVFPTLSPEERQALRRRIEADLAQIKACQTGDHRLEATKSPGVLVCRVCRIVGVCLWCGLIPPPGAVILVCPAHHDLVRLQAIALGTPLLSVPPVPPAAVGVAAAGAQEKEE